jgi:hypothetical protein
MNYNHNNEDGQSDESFNQRRRDFLKTVGIGAAGVGFFGSEFGGTGTASAQVNGDFTPRARRCV